MIGGVACVFADRPRTLTSMPSRPIVIGNTIKAAHLVLTGYGHWLPNDPRGSGSEQIKKLSLQQLGPIHFGRKQQQPPRGVLKTFYREAEHQLDHDVLWFDQSTRNLIGKIVGDVSKANGYTIWALAVMQNHLHAVVRTHRHDFVEILSEIGAATRDAVLRLGVTHEDHPVWANRPYKVYLHQNKIAGRIRYVEENPMKSRIDPQRWSFVVPFTG
jgi:REP element-mobilizing transposase RayT